MVKAYANSTRFVVKDGIYSQFHIFPLGRGEESESKRFSATALGRACVSSSLSPLESKQVFDDLKVCTYKNKAHISLGERRTRTSVNNFLTFDDLKVYIDKKKRIYH